MKDNFFGTLAWDDFMNLTRFVPLLLILHLIVACAPQDDLDLVFTIDYAPFSLKPSLGLAEKIGTTWRFRYGLAPAALQ
jgi:hypothetical protein